MARGSSDPHGLKPILRTPIRPPCFAQNGLSLTLQRHARKHAHKGGSGAMTLRKYPPRVQHANPDAQERPHSGPSGLGAGNVACTCDVLWRRFMGRTFCRRPIGGLLRKESRLEASPSGFRPPPLVPGLFWFRARVILLADGRTRPTPRLLVRGTVQPFPHPEPPLLLALLGGAPSPGPNRVCR